ncbi:hypothetical protein B2G52_03390 [Neisseria lactamica]|uniref:PilS cassette n=1 Tax=Neisseria lactamica TaxID=486 RepID=A0AAU8VE96_NEILA|nr:hypothetical protein B2G52_03390 [Neisseria lactamica]
MPTRLDSRLRGNDGGAVSVFSDKFLKLKISSFPQEQKTKNRNLKFVIPTRTENQKQKPKIRHSHESGNLFR